MAKGTIRRNVAIMAGTNKFLPFSFDYTKYFVILEEKAIILYLKAVPRIEKKLGYELATVLISSFCRNLLVNVIVLCTLC